MTSRAITETHLTGIPLHRRGKVRDVYVLARRGPAQAKFTNPELKELGELEIADLVIDACALVLDPASQEAARQDAGIQRRQFVFELCRARRRDRRTIRR